MKHYGRLFLLGGVCTLSAGVALAQAPPGPLTPPPAQASRAESAPPPPKKAEVAPRKTIMGAWRFNKDESDDGRERMKQSKETDSSNRGGYGGPRVSGPWPGGGGPMGGGGYGHPRADGEDESDRLGDLVNPPREMLLVRHNSDDPEVELTDDRQRRRVFFTDGRTLQKPKGPDYQEIAAHWDGNKLVTDEKGAHNGKVSRIFELSSDGKQLVENIHITDSKGNHPVNVQYVYDAVDDSSLSFNSHY